MTAKLYCFGESGHSYKVALTLEMAGLAWDPIFVDFFNGEHKSPEYLKNINEMGEVPVFVDGDRKLTQSAVIQTYLCDRTGRFQPPVESDKSEVLRWLFWDNHKLSAQLGPLRFIMNFLPEEHRSQDVINFLKGRVKIAYKILNAHLADRAWIVGETMTAADIACCSYLYYPEEFGFVRKDWPHIDAWLTRISKQPGWKHPYDLMPGSPADRA